MRRASLNAALAFIHLEEPVMDAPSRLLVVTARLLRFFPALLLAFALVCVGLGVRDLFFQAADQLVSVDGALSGRRQ